jgi:hypothetical protein
VQFPIGQSVLISSSDPVASFASFQSLDRSRTHSHTHSVCHSRSHTHHLLALSPEYTSLTGTESRVLAVGLHTKTERSK